MFKCHATLWRHIASEGVAEPNSEARSLLHRPLTPWRVSAVVGTHNERNQIEKTLKIRLDQSLENRCFLNVLCKKLNIWKISSFRIKWIHLLKSEPLTLNVNERRFTIHPADKHHMHKTKPMESVVPFAIRTTSVCIVQHVWMCDVL